MRTILKKLISVLLSQESSMTASDLAKELQVSERSVKNYIAQINQSEEIISSSHKGYQIDKDNARRLWSDSGQKHPESKKERQNFIITKLITNDASKEKKTDLYELADEMFISFETLKKELPEVKKQLREYDLSISSVNSYVMVEGEELDKRKLLSHILFDEFKNNVMSLEVMEREFADYDLKLLKRIIREACNEYRYYVNDYGLLNMVLDIVIGIDRIKKERTFYTPRKEAKRYGFREQELAQKIAAAIEEHYEIVFSSVELEELTIILISHLMKVDVASLNEENLEQVVGAECIQMVKSIREMLKNTYYIDTNNRDFIVKFTLHIKNLLLRLEHGYVTKNPLLDHIRNTCPLIFECAVEIAHKLKELTHSDIAEDEIAYLALHIGSNLENQKSRRKTISCTLLFPQYYDFASRIVERIAEIYQDSLEIKNVITQAEELKELKKTDLVISTVPLEDITRFEWVMITPFLSERDIATLNDKIQKIFQQKKKIRLKMNLMEISHPTLFLQNAEFSSKEEAISYMAEIMEKEGYVDSNFYQEVFERESQASTAFSHIAVPHALKMNARKTGMFILVNEKKAMPWDKSLVNIVLLFAINENQKNIFHDVYDNLIVLLPENKNIARVAKATSYISFIEEIVGCYQ